MMTRQHGKPTIYPGVYQLGPKAFRIRAKVRDPKTNRPKEIDRVLEGLTAPQAAAARGRLMTDSTRDAPAPLVKTLGDFAPLWLEGKPVSQGTAENYASLLETRILPTLGHHLLEKLALIDVQLWVNGLARDGLTPATITTIARLLIGLLRDAAALLRLPVLPFDRLSLPEVPDTQGNTLTGEQLAHVLQSLAARRSPAHLVAGTLLGATGLRQCHVFALRWEDVDLETGTLTVRQRFYRGQLAPVSRKKRAPRTLRLATEVLPCLVAFREWQLRHQVAGLEHGWLFPSRSERDVPQWPREFNRAWKTALAAAGVTAKVTPHGLRRTFNDLARLAGIDGVVIRAFTGHSSDAMRASYSTIGGDEQQAAMGKVLKLVQVGTAVGTAPAPTQRKGRK